MLTQVTAKLGNMRKAVNWVVYPPSKTESADTPKLLIQSATRIALIDVQSKKAVLSAHRPNGAYFVHLHMPGRSVVDVPEDVLAALQAAQPQSGDTIGNGVVRIA